MSNLKAAAVGAAVASVVATGAVALAGSGVGGIFNLGQTNTVNAPSTLSGNSGGNAMLKVQNAGNGPALSAVVPRGIPPFKVSSTTKVTGLNADFLDGNDSNRFLSGGTIDFHFAPWQYMVGGSTHSQPGLWDAFISTTDTGAASVNAILPLDLPTSILGKTLRLESVEICYRSSGMTIEQTNLTSVAPPATTALLYNDNVLRDSRTDVCYSVAPTQPNVPAGWIYLYLGLHYFSNADTMYLYGVTARLTT